MSADHPSLFQTAVPRDKHDESRPLFLSEHCPLPQLSSKSSFFIHPNYIPVPHTEHQSEPRSEQHTHMFDSFPSCPLLLPCCHSQCYAQSTTHNPERKPCHEDHTITKQIQRVQQCPCVRYYTHTLSLPPSDRMAQRLHHYPSILRNGGKGLRSGGSSVVAVSEPEA